MLIDLSYPLNGTFPTFPGDPVWSESEALTLPTHCVRVRKITFGTHFATHIDAPAHVLEHGRTLDEFPPGTFFGPARVLDLGTLPPRTPISLGMLAPHRAAIRPGARLLLRTGWELDACRERGLDFFEDAPFLETEAAAWLAECRLTLLGLDVPSPDDFRAQDLPAHGALLGAGVPIVENLRNLRKISARDFTLSAFPLPLSRADAAPVRAFAVGK